MAQAFTNLSDNMTFDKLDQMIKNADLHLDGDGPKEFQEFAQLVRHAERGATLHPAFAHAREHRTKEEEGATVQILARQTSEDVVTSEACPPNDETAVATCALRSQPDVRPIPAVNASAKVLSRQIPEQAPGDEAGAAAGRNLQERREREEEEKFAKEVHEEAERATADWLEFTAGMRRETDALIASYHVHKYRAEQIGKMSHASARTSSEAQREQDQGTPKAKKDSMKQKRAAVETQDKGSKTAKENEAVVIESHSSDPGFLGRLTSFSRGTIGSTVTRGTAKAKEKKDVVEVAL